MKLSNVGKCAGFAVLFAVSATIVSCGESDVFGTGGDLEKILSSKKLVVGTEATYAPFEYTDSAGNILGFDVDVIDLVKAKIDATYDTDIDVVFKSLNFDGLITSLNANQIDLIAAAMTITDERAESVLFSDPYFTAESVVVVLEDNSAITSMETLKSAVCGAQLGTVQGDTISSTADGWNSSNKTLTSVSDLVLALQAKSIDALVVEKPVAQSIIAKQSGMKIVSTDLINFDDAGDYGIASNYTIGADLITLVNGVIAEGTADGSLTTLFEEAAATAASING
jgi:arginine/lysine/histidine transporter system substrate-binding protein